MAAVSDTEWLPAPPADTPRPTDRQIGRFRVERELGRGGMGVVYLAHDADLNRPVAVKLLREADPETLARFRLEAHALGGLAHPNAVRVYEAGDHAGRPFLALEYVAGRTLHDAVRGGPMDPKRAADILSQVAGAVQAAHDLGVVHRDLKPANVLLDAADAPKLTDFGVARRLGGSDGLTATNIALGTPGYMAPEQAAGQAPDARTDVYGLGATLYECLTGRPPFVGPTAAVLTAVMRDDPVSPRRLNAAVPPDVDTVCLKCLEKDPSRRYATAAELAADLQRVVRGEPVLARPTGPVGRAVRWTRRNRLPAALLAGCVLSLVGGAGAAGWQAVRATAARDAEAGQRQLAQDQAAVAKAAQRRAEDQAAAADRERAAALAARREAEDKRDEAAAVTEFLVDDLLGQADAVAQADGGRTPTPNLTVRQAVDRAAAAVGERFPGRPATAEAVRQVLGDAYRGVGEPAKAVAQLRPVYDARLARLGPDHLDTLAALSRLASAYAAGGRPADALPLLEEQVRAFRQLGSSGDSDLVNAIGSLATAYAQIGRRADALKLWEEAHQAKRELFGPGHQKTLMAASNLAEQYRLAGRTADALTLQEEAVRLTPEAFGPDHPHVLVFLNNLANLYAESGRSADAVAAYGRVLGRARATLGPDHPTTLAVLANVAACNIQAGRLADGLPLQEEAWQATRAKFGPDHPHTLLVMGATADARRLAGWAAEAERLADDCLAARRQVSGPDHPDTLLAWNVRGRCRLAAGRPADAARDLADCLAARRRVLGPAHPQVLVSLVDLGEALLADGRPDDARTALEEAVRGRAARGEANSAEDVAAARTALGECLARLGRPADAESHLRAAAVVPGRHAAAARRRLADLTAAAGRSAEAAGWRVELAPHPRTAGH